MALVELERFNSRIEADVAHGCLEAAGVESFVFPGDRGEFGSIRIMTDESDYDEAVRVLREAQRR